LRGWISSQLGCTQVKENRFLEFVGWRGQQNQQNENTLEKRNQVLFMWKAPIGAKSTAYVPIFALLNLCSEQVMGQFLMAGANLESIVERGSGGSILQHKDGRRVFVSGDLPVAEMPSNTPLSGLHDRSRMAKALKFDMLDSMMGAMRARGSLVAPDRAMPLMCKSHISSYSKKDGTFVAAHEDRRVAVVAAPVPVPVADNGDWMQALFGSSYSDAPVAPAVSNVALDPAILASAVSAMREGLESERSVWSGKSYKANGKKIEFFGDGPSSGAMSIQAINEGRKAKHLLAIAAQLSALDKLESRMKSSPGALAGDFSQLWSQAQQSHSDSAGALFERLAIDHLKMQPAKGAYASLPLTKMLRNLFESQVV